ncbi:Flagellar hook-associated protein flgK [Burkholderia gladioli]|nr:Flagellar hook-associated protein flgK [Burkholderia gladioli]
MPRRAGLHSIAPGFSTSRAIRHRLPSLQSAFVAATGVERLSKPVGMPLALSRMCDGRGAARARAKLGGSIRIPSLAAEPEPVAAGGSAEEGGSRANAAAGPQFAHEAAARGAGVVGSDRRPV